jgi:hypothetical protein
VEFDINDVGLNEFLFSGKWSMIKKEELAYTRKHKSIVCLDSYLGGILNAPADAQPVLMPLCLLKELRHMGLLNCHLKNQLMHTHDKRVFLVVKCLVQRLARMEEEDMCLLMFLVLCPSAGAAAASLAAAFATRSVVERGSELPSAQPGADPGDEERVTSTLGKAKAEMMLQLAQPCQLANYFFDMDNVRDSDELFSLPI